VQFGCLHWHNIHIKFHGYHCSGLNFEKQDTHRHHSHLSQAYYFHFQESRLKETRNPLTCKKWCWIDKIQNTWINRFTMVFQLLYFPQTVKATSICLICWLDWLVLNFLNWVCMRKLHFWNSVVVMIQICWFTFVHQYLISENSNKMTLKCTTAKNKYIYIYKYIHSLDSYWFTPATFFILTA